MYKAFRQQAQEDLPLIFLTHFTFISVARDALQNAASNRRLAVSSWADAWLAPTE